MNPCGPPSLDEVSRIAKQEVDSAKKNNQLLLAPLLARIEELEKKVGLLPTQADIFRMIQLALSHDKEGYI